MNFHDGDCVFNTDYSDCCDLGCGKTWYHWALEDRDKVILQLKKENQRLKEYKYALDQYDNFAKFIQTNYSKGNYGKNYGDIAIDVITNLEKENVNLKVELDCYKRFSEKVMGLL